jgi:glycosyltransferase involved in cell wall biosynthesis
MVSVSARPHRIVFSGTDQKFIAQFESHLKKKGHMVRRDLWEWGEPQFIERSKRLSEWADFVFCEWALANAVWYSNNKNENQRVVVRLHSQEIRERASKFPRQMKNMDQVVFVAEHIKNSAIEMFGWDDWPIEMIPNYVNCEKMRREKVQSAAKTIGIVGVVPMSKRLDRALDLIEKIRKNDSEWTLIVKGKLPHDYPWMKAPGRADEKKYFHKQFQRIEKSKLLKEGVVFEEFSPYIENYYSRVGYVLSPSDFESFHYTIPDGVASGAFPVIWPWEGADKLYPKDWIAEDTESAMRMILENSVRSDLDKESIANKRFEYIQSKFDSSVIFDKLEQALFADKFCLYRDSIALSDEGTTLGMN